MIPLSLPIFAAVLVWAWTFATSGEIPPEELAKWDLPLVTDEE